MSDEVIYNETGIGDLKDKTPYYNFNIPYFDIATWHDYIEENFRSIDALFHYIYEIKQYKGKWENNTLYEVEDVLFITDKNSQYNGRLVKVLIEHTTSDIPFDNFYESFPHYYELFEDAHAANLYAIEAKEAKNIAVLSEQNARAYSESALNYMQQSINSANQSKISENNSYNYQEVARESADIAKNAAEVIKLFPYIEKDVIFDKDDWKNSETNEAITSNFVTTYPYECTAVLNNDTISTDILENLLITGNISIETDEAMSGNYAPICYFHYNNEGKIIAIIYSKIIPTKDIIGEVVMAYCKEE